MPDITLAQAQDAIAHVLNSQRMAGPHFYEVVWIKNHFVCRKRQKPDKEQYFIINLKAIDINEGLSRTQWSTITGRLRTLIETGVIK